MKKIYIIPAMSVVRMHGESILAVSGVCGKIGTADDIGFGGIDENGVLDPEVKGSPYGETLFD